MVLFEWDWVVWYRVIWCEVMVLFFVVGGGLEVILGYYCG